MDFIRGCRPRDSSEFADSENLRRKGGAESTSASLQE